jgi:ferrochelatase
MKIETLVNLIKGELLNRPFISEVTSFTKDVDEVKRGSCFFSNDFNEIKQAVKNGAYAIVSEKEFEIIDKEIAWIKTNSFKKAIFDIFKYENIKTKIYYTDKITAHILKQMNNDKKVIVLENEEKMLKALNLGEKYLISFNPAFKEIFKNIEELKKNDIKLEQITLFKSKYENIELNLPFVYKDNFSKALNFFNKNNLKYSLEFELERFKPVFINGKFEKVEYGESDKVLIVGIENDEYFFKELNYLIDNTKYAKTLIIGESNKEDLKKHFNFAMIVDMEIELKEKVERNLFD